VIEVASYTLGDGQIIAGEVISNGGERRMVTGQSGTSLTLSYPFAGLGVGDTVTLRKGCDHSFATCKAKFSNGERYGGFPIVPDKNPFSSSL
jgi:hypothetical protein